MKLGTLEEYTAEELKALPYRDICRLRLKAFAAHVAKMRDDDQAAGEERNSAFQRLERWADRMTKRYGPQVQVWHDRMVMGWLEALMVVRYGEDPMQWPPAFSEEDVVRADRWLLRGSTPNGVVYLETDDEAGFLATGGLITALVKGLGALAALLGLAGLATAMSDYLENQLIDHLWRGRAYTAPATMHFALYTAAPGETGGGTEVSGGSYARVGVSAVGTEFEGTGGETTDTDSTGTDGQTENINAITFPTPTANWGTITHFGVLDASSGGNLITYGSLADSKNVNNGDPAPNYPAGAFTFTFA